VQSLCRLKLCWKKKAARMGEIGGGGGQQGCFSREGVCECRGFNEGTTSHPAFSAVNQRRVRGPAEVFTPVSGH
jgi:hypothetical protein